MKTSIATGKQPNAITNAIFVVCKLSLGSYQCDKLWSVWRPTRERGDIDIARC